MVSGCSERNMDLEPKVFRDGKADISFLVGEVPMAVLSSVLATVPLTTATIFAPAVWKTVANTHDLQTVRDDMKLTLQTLLE